VLLTALTTTSATNVLTTTSSSSSATSTILTCSAESDMPKNTTLLPIANNNANRTLVLNLVPSKFATLYYTKPAPGAQALSLGFAMLYHLVTLEGSSLITSMVCTLDSITITVTSQDALTMLPQWPESNMVVMTNNQGCDPSDERRIYLMSSSVMDGVGILITLQITPQT
jgi:hypothetical protein